MDAFMLFGFTVTYAFIWKVVRIALYIGIGIPLLNFIINVSMRAMKGRGTRHVRMLLSKVLYYGGFSLIIIFVLNELGFQVSALLGAAGIFGVAIGFAAQTSMSNLISGLFLLSEGFLTAGDLIKVGGIVGVVQAIDLFSVKVKTFNDEFVRIPNESLIKSDLINMTHFPNRRVNVEVAIPASNSLDEFLAILNGVADKNNLVVKDPTYDILVNSITSSALRVTLRMWTKNENFLSLKKEIAPQIKSALEQKEIKLIYAIVE